MGDIICAICGEPWDAYGVRHGDMTKSEAQKFLAGKGCPCCKGEKPQEDIPAFEDKFLFSLLDNFE